MPPSAKTNACTMSTVVITMAAANGPRRIAASAPPAKCPDVPPATGKLSICNAKMSAAVTAISTILRWSKCFLTHATEYATYPAEATPVTAAVVFESIPSGMCMAVPLP